MWAQLRTVLPGLAAAHAAGAIGGVIGVWIGAPLPWLLGGLIGSAALAAMLPRGVGGPWTPAARLRSAFVVIIGVMIGGGFRPELISSLTDWLPSLIGLLAFTITAQLLIYAFYRAIGIDRPTAWFGSSPGGLIENILLGEAAGADIRRLTLLQFGRIAATVTLVPLLYSLWVGEAVGSAAGERYGDGAALTLYDAFILTAAGAIGWAVARRLRLPAGVIVGPVAASAFVHAIGWTDGQVPAWLVALAQLVVGVGVGLRFGGLSAGAMGRVLGVSLISVVVMLSLAVAIARIVMIWSNEPLATLILSYAPGGIIEMGLIAVSLGASPVFVTAHHVVRVIIAVTLAPAIYARFFRRD